MCPREVLGQIGFPTEEIHKQGLQETETVWTNEWNSLRLIVDASGFDYN